MPFRQFNQSELTAALGPRAQGGVCKVLVMEWLAAGGDLDRAIRNLRMVSRRRGNETIQSVSAAVGKRIEDAQANTMPWDLVREYGLVRVGGNDSAAARFSSSSPTSRDTRATTTSRSTRRTASRAPATPSAR